jgi:hypothetical protein
VSEDAGRRYVRFTRSAGERIGRAVLAVEGASRPSDGLAYEHPIPVLSNARVFRIATFTGKWDINTFKTVTFRNSTNTASVENLFVTLPSPPAGATVGIAKDGTQWELVTWPMSTATAIFVAATQSTTFLTDVKLQITLNTQFCSIDTKQTNSTASCVVFKDVFTSNYFKLSW